MPQYPRRVSRGILKGQEFQSEKEYRKALEKASGKTRYQRRNEKAQALGYSGYSERRRVLRKQKEQGKDLRHVAGKGELALTVEYLAQNYKTQTREQRIAAMEIQAERLGVPRYTLYGVLYQVIDARGLRHGR